MGGAAARSAFSAIVSLGDKIDVDFSDCLDFFSADPGTRAILLYMESIDNAQKFMSAARAAARIEAGRRDQGGAACAGRQGCRHPHGRAWRVRMPFTMPPSDARACCACSISTSFLPPPKRSDGRSRFRESDWRFSPMAAAWACSPSTGLIDLGGTLADVVGSHDGTAERRACRPTGRMRNPVDIIGDADAARYTLALDALLTDDENDAILILNVPTAVAERRRCGTRRRRSVAGASRRRDAPEAGICRVDRRGSGIRRAFSSRCASRISPPRRMRCAGSSSSCATARRRTS